MEFYQHIVDQEFFNIPTGYIISIYHEAVDNSNILLLFEIFYFFIKLTYINGQYILDGFFKNLSDNEIQQFYLNVLELKNFYLTRLYLVFHFNYYRYTKSKSIASPIYFKIFDKFINLTKYLLDDIQPTHSLSESEYDYEKRDCIMYLINIFNEMITRDTSILL
jgi:hypothetical protein